MYSLRTETGIKTKSGTSAGFYLFKPVFIAIKSKMNTCGEFGAIPCFSASSYRGCCNLNQSINKKRTTHEKTKRRFLAAFLLVLFPARFLTITPRYDEAEKHHRRINIINVINSGAEKIKTFFPLKSKADVKRSYPQNQWMKLGISIYT